MPLRLWGLNPLAMELAELLLQTWILQLRAG